jgi:hypothetical protein
VWPQASGYNFYSTEVTAEGHGILLACWLQ